MSKPSSPYVGPRPFEREHAPLFFGRDTRARRAGFAHHLPYRSPVVRAVWRGQKLTGQCRLIPLLEAEF